VSTRFATLYSERSHWQEAAETLAPVEAAWYLSKANQTVPRGDFQQIAATLILC
jgi:hypothetical protein